MTAAPLRVVLYEGQGSEPIEPAARYDILRGLLEKGYSVTRSTTGGQVSAPDESSLLVMGRFSGGVPGDSFAGSGAAVQIRDIGALQPPAVVELVDAVATEETRKPGGWKPWFPVIDYDRCTNCMQCLSFCLFDVYGVDNGKIQVRNQSNCKTDCPACSRVCPEVAILFPKYRSGPINGDEVNAEDVRREAMKVDISALLGGDIYQALRDRSAHAKSRFSKERDEGRALKERQKCLIKLQQDLDIPPEVLASLPSPDQIKAKAEQAAARAEAALAAAGSSE
jgi:NAD-dependent dihydropyrimidine dehydrogenase PreA subunit